MIAVASHYQKNLRKCALLHTLGFYSEHLKMLIYLSPRVATRHGWPQGLWSGNQVRSGRECDVRVRGYKREGTEKVAGEMCVCVCVGVWVWCVYWSTETMIKMQAWGVSAAQVGRLIKRMWADTEPKLAGMIQTEPRRINEELILQVLEEEGPQHSVQAPEET